ncbi:MAG TPA: hypothetical protein PLI19_03240 [Erysipelotrichaceae bacterium]|nr:hypothetical protein [Erysipelotrichaceae bacterium]HQB32327.1 hypothetical protein [Erysipelotrichaceae bacterium]
MIERILEKVAKEFKMIEKENKEFRFLQLNGMNFNNSSYYAEGLGNIGIMKVTDDKGIMEMAGLIINPFELDGPLLSYDHIKMMGNNILYLEPFNTTIGNSFDCSGIANIAEKYAEVIENNPQKIHWYEDLRMAGTIFKKSNKSAAIEEMIDEYYNEYLKALLKCEKCDIRLKKEKAAIYSAGLIENGGPATDPFLEAFGKEKTRDFFRQLLFGA